MKDQRFIFSGFVLCLVLCASLSPALAQGTAFTYQGRLINNGVPASGLHDFQFSLWAATSGAPQVGSTLPVLSVPVTNGLFTVVLDFGPGCFTGPYRWLQIAARTNGAAGYDLLSPRQWLTPVPYAIMAGGLSDVLPSAQLVGTYDEWLAFNNAANTYSGSGANLTALNASQLSSGTAPATVLSNAWRLVGNAGTLPGTHFVGTTDNQPLDLGVNGKRAVRLIPGGVSPCLVGGDSNNTAGAGLNGIVIAGGGAFGVRNEAHSSYSAIGGGSANLIASDGGYAVIGGGYGNVVSTNAGYAVIAGGRAGVIQSNADYSVLGGGYENAIHDLVDYSVVGGGNKNVIQYNSDYGFIGGGRQNRIETNAIYSTVGGGWSNVVAALAGDATIGGGRYNTIRENADFTVIAGGLGNEIYSGYGAIGGGNSNMIMYPCSYGTIAGGQDNRMLTNATGSAIGGGVRNLIQGAARGSVIGGGYFNTIASNALYTVVGGGFSNLAERNAQFVVLAGGQTNSVGASASYAAVGGGRNNRVTDGGYCAIIPGGWDNVATNSCLAAGRRAKAIHYGSFVWGDFTDGDVNSSAANSFVVRASGGVRFYSNAATNAGVSLAAGGTSWAIISDRNEKKNFAPVDGREVLDRLAQVPIERWNYRWEEDGDVPHIGPMAQDFKAAFYPGRDDTSITTLEMDGVALAAIQGLNERLREKDAQIVALEERLATLERQMEAGR